MSQSEPVCMAMRVNITSGAVNGNNDPQKASWELGCWKICMIMTMERIIGIITRNCNCWASCSEFTMEPTAAHRVLYKM